MYDTILVPTDGSEHATRAAEHALHVARTFDATVHVLNALDLQTAAGPFSAGGVDESYVESLEDEGREAIREIEATADAGDRIQTAVVRGQPAEVVLEYAGEHGADAIAMGTHGRTGVRRYVTGSVAARAVRESDVPVLTVRATERSRIEGDYDEILLPTDGSDPATEAVEHALALADVSGARIHVVNVVDVREAAASQNYTPPTEYVERMETAGEEATDEIAAQARDAGLEAVTAVRKGYPARGILEYADEHDVDLVAMGTHGRTGLSRFLLGSTAERVIRHAEVPVLSVNPPERMGL